MTARNPELYSHIRTDKQRIAKYNAKTDPATVRPKRAARLPGMRDAYAPSAREAELLETRVRNFLNLEQVQSCLRTFYLDFARQLYWKAVKKFSSYALLQKAVHLRDHWDREGLDYSTLNKLALDLFDINLAPVLSLPKDAPGLVLRDENGKSLAALGMTEHGSALVRWDEKGRAILPTPWSVRGV